MRIIKGDLIEMALSGRFDVIIHGCNCFHTMGAGVANTIRVVFPEAYTADCHSKFACRDKLGTYTHANVNDGDLVVVNGYTQYDYRVHVDNIGRKYRNVDYHAVRCLFAQLKHDFAGKRIGYPKIGAGLAGGDWRHIAQIIDSELRGEDHTLVVYQPAPPVSPAPFAGRDVYRTNQAMRYEHFQKEQSRQQFLHSQQRQYIELQRNNQFRRSSGSLGPPSPHVNPYRRRSAPAVQADHLDPALLCSNRSRTKDEGGGSNSDSDGSQHGVNGPAHPRHAEPHHHHRNRSNSNSDNNNDSAHSAPTRDSMDISPRGHDEYNEKRWPNNQDDANLPYSPTSVASGRHRLHPQNSNNAHHRVHQHQQDGE